MLDLLRLEPAKPASTPGMPSASVEHSEQYATLKPRFSVQKLFKKSTNISPSPEATPRYKHVPRAAQKGHLMTTLRVISSSKENLTSSPPDVPAGSSSATPLYPERSSSISPYTLHALQLRAALNKVEAQNRRQYEAFTDEPAQSRTSTLPARSLPSRRPRVRDSGIFEVDFRDPSAYERESRVPAQREDRTFRDSALGDDLEDNTK